ncbi:hypothetical protein GCM10027615_43080 [Plantactinospora veratri]
MLGSPTVSISGSASRIDSQSKNVSHSVARVSIASPVSDPESPAGRGRPAGDCLVCGPGQLAGVAAGLVGPALTGGYVTVPLPGLKLSGTGRPG